MSQKKETEKQLNRYIQFREIIEQTQDHDMMATCLQLLRDMMELNTLREQVEKKEEDLYKDPKRSFYHFFLEGLSPEEISQLTDKCSGRSKILDKKEMLRKEAAEKEAAEKQEALKAETASEKIP